jgi:hypothetical protein
MQGTEDVDEFPGLESNVGTQNGWQFLSWKREGEQ